MRQQLFFEDHLKDFANDKNEAGGSELTWTCYLVPIFRNLSSLKIKMKYPSK